MRLLVDTNVFLDLALKREEGCENALQFFIWCRKNKNQILITSMSLRDIEYIAMRNLHDKHKAKEVLTNVYSICTKVVGVSADSAITSIYEDYKDYEDEMLVQTAKEQLADAIITNNIKDYTNRGVHVFTPIEIVQLASR